MKEIIDAVNGFMEKDVKELTYEIASNILIMSGKANNKSEATEMINDVIISKKVREKFRKLIEIQNGDLNYVTDKNAPINLYCAAGGRASAAKSTLISMGYTNVANLGGYSDAIKKINAYNNNKSE